MVTVNVVENNNLAQALLTLLRDKNTPTEKFRDYLKKIGAILTSEASQEFDTKDTKVITPMDAETKGVIIEEDIVILAILRAGMFMAEGVRYVLPNSRIGFVGIEKAEGDTEIKYISIPEISGKTVIIVDPILATGCTISKIIEKPIFDDVKKIIIITVIATEEGIYKLADIKPDIAIYTAAVDPELDEKAFVIPGLGDAAKRAFGW